MPQVSHTAVVPVAREDVWRFVRDINNWATEVPGYQEHVVVDDALSRWKVKGDLKVVSRVMDVEVVVTDWREPDEVCFSVRGLNEQVQGQGRFVTTANGPDETALGFYLEMHAGGTMGPMVNALLQPILPKLASVFAGNLARRLAAAATA